MRMMFVMPVDGKQVRDPDTMAHIPQEGRMVLASPYFLRRLRDGSLVEVVEATPEPAPVVAPAPTLAPFPAAVVAEPKPKKPSGRKAR